MSVLKSKYWAPRQYVTTSDLSDIEAFARADFAAVATLLGQYSILYGFEVTGTVSRPVSTITVNQNGVIVGNASVPLYIPTTTSTITGGWIPDQTNYITLQLAMANSATLVPYQVRNDNGEQVTVMGPQAIVTGHTLTVGAAPTSLTLAAVVTDASNNIVSITDLRSLLFDSNPDPTGTALFQALPTARGQVQTLETMLKTLTTKAWMQGGEFWYSKGSDVHGMHIAGDWDTTGETAPDLSWTDLRILFDNSTGWYNIVAAGTRNLNNDGECIYVDIDRHSNATVVAAVTTLANLGMPAADSGHGPGDRIVLAWRSNGKKFVRGQFYAVGGTSQTATVSKYGLVKLNVARAGAETRVAVVDDNTKIAMAVGISRGLNSAVGENAGLLEVGTGANDTSIQVGGTSTTLITSKATKQVLDTPAAVGSGNLVEMKNNGTNVATLPFDGKTVVGTDILTRAQIAWGIGRLANPLATGYTATDAIAAAMTLTTTDADAIGIAWEIS